MVKKGLIVFGVGAIALASAMFLGVGSCAGTTSGTMALFAGVLGIAWADCLLLLDSSHG